MKGLKLSVAGLIAWSVSSSVALSNEEKPREEKKPDLYSGTYVLLQQTTTVAEVPVVADVVASTRAVSLQKLRFEGDRLYGQGTLCDLRIESSSSLVKTELPAAFRRALPPVRTDARLLEQDGKLFFQQGWQTLVVGARLERPDAPLPTSAEDPRVVDADGDGQPGVTVKVSGLVSGEIYLVQRSRSRFRGEQVKDGFRGRIEFENEQSILGATRSVLKSAPDAKPDWNRSFFYLKKVPDSTSCAAATQIAESLR